MEAYLAGDLETAEDLFTQFAAAHPDNADAQAWLAETQRRRGELEEAWISARAALEIEPCHAFAHTVMAEVANPMFNPGGPHSSADDAWAHILRAAECDPEDGNVWLEMWSQALRRGDEKREKASLRNLVATGFLTPAVLAYSRWMLRDLPQNAVLLTNGDMDTYPPLALQLTEDFRTDVGIINYSLLNTEWYPEVVARRYHLPLPKTEFLSYRDDAGVLVLKSKQLVGFWMSNAEAMVRPFTVAVTVQERRFTEDSARHLQLAGGFYRYLPAVEDPPVDSDTLKKGLAALALDPFSGPMASNQDRSPIRRAWPPRLAHNILAVAMRQATLDYDDGNIAEARDLASWAEKLDKIIPGPPPDSFDFTGMVNRIESGEDKND